MTAFSHLKGPAAVELADEIEQLTPNAARLSEFGFGPAVVATIVKAIATGHPDMAEMRAVGLDQATAVEIAQSITARHARVAAALARAAELPPGKEPEPVAPPTDDAVDCALWQLAELSDMIRKGDACATKLGWAGYSATASAELAALIRRANRNT